jgi:hypothetical protein
MAYDIGPRIGIKGEQEFNNSIKLLILKLSPLFIYNVFITDDDIETVKNDKHIRIQTLEGDMKASFGDYIIKGVNGEFYPCKPDIFEKTYESIE